MSSPTVYDSHGLRATRLMTRRWRSPWSVGQVVPEIRGGGGVQPPAGSRTVWSPVTALGYVDRRRGYATRFPLRATLSYATSVAKLDRALSFHFCWRGAPASCGGRAGPSGHRAERSRSPNAASDQST